MLRDLILALAVATSAPIVETESGPIAGEVSDDGSFAFRAIPFAAPPVGDLRWRPPQPVTPWTETRDVSALPPSCAQHDYGWNTGDTVTMAEDCLYLAVRTPTLEPEAPLPVMVWIHGGNNTTGRGAWGIEGTLHRRGIVVVSLQYRLGAFGFMAHPSLSAEENGASGNYALMDEQAALRWVRDNIARFGGDPNNVTLFGESVGAQHVALQMQSPGARGLFHKAIAQSGWSNFSLPTITQTQAEEQGRLIAEAAGLAREADAAALRALSVSQVLAAQEAAPAPFNPNHAVMFILPVVDQRVLMDDPRAMLARDEAVSVSLIVGSNAREENIWGASNFAAAGAAIAAAFGARAADALALYGLQEGGAPVSDPRLGSAPLQAATDILYRCPVAAVSRSGVRSNVAVWQYQFDHNGPSGEAVGHASDVAHVFVFNADEADRFAPMQAYWANFARTGNPNGTGLRNWRRWEPRGRAYLEFTNDGPVARQRLREPLCDWLRTP